MSDAIKISSAMVLTSVARLEEERPNLSRSDERVVAELRAKAMERYGSMITSIESPQLFAQTWHDMLSAMLCSADRILHGLNGIVARYPGRSPDSKLDADEDAIAMRGIAPSVASLRTFFDLSKVFHKNLRMRGTWEEVVVRGNRHHLGNALFYMTFVDRFFEDGRMTVAYLQNVIEEARDVFDPLSYVATTYNNEDAGKWLRISAGGDAGESIRPANGPRLRRASDEIFYRAGRKANGVPEEVSIGWLPERGVISFRSENGALEDFARDAGARSKIEKICGKENVEFIPQGSGGHEGLSEIQISAMEMGAEVYTTGTSIPLATATAPILSALIKPI